MDVSGGGEVAVSHPSAAGGFLSLPTRLLVPVFLSAVFSHLDLEETRWQMGKHAGVGAKMCSYWGAPCLHRPMSCIRWRCCCGRGGVGEGEVGGVSRESNGRLYSISLHQD